MIRRLTMRYPSMQMQSVQDFYELRRSAQEANASLNRAIDRGDEARVEQILRRYGFELQVAALLEPTAEVLNLLRKQIDQERRSLNMPGPKRDAMDRLVLQELDMVRQAMKEAKALKRDYQQRELAERRAATLPR